MQTLPAPEKIPDALDWDLWLGGAAFRPPTSGDDAYRKEYNSRFGFYLPLNWRGFFDFGTEPDRRLGISPTRPRRSRSAPRQSDEHGMSEAG
jgi:hypothetical protein